jgi:hypothetical protein
MYVIFFGGGGGNGIVSTYCVLYEIDYFVEL